MHDLDFAGGFADQDSLMAEAMGCLDRGFAQLDAEGRVLMANAAFRAL